MLNVENWNSKFDSIDDRENERRADEISERLKDEF